MAAQSDKCMQCKVKDRHFDKQTSVLSPYCSRDCRREAKHPNVSKASVYNPIALIAPIAPIASIYFWKPQERVFGCFSNWSAHGFTYKGEQFVNSEQALMWEKAMQFDRAMCAQIMAQSDPAKIKNLGGQVRNYNELLWDGCRYGLMVEILVAKFGQNPDICAILLQTGTAELVEASSYDPIWGIGFEAANAEANRARWGRNLLGKALVEARVRLGGMRAVVPAASVAMVAASASAASVHAYVHAPPKPMFVDLCLNCKAKPKHPGFDCCGLTCGRAWDQKKCVRCHKYPKNQGHQFCSLTCGQAVAQAAAQAAAHAAFHAHAQVARPVASSGMCTKCGKRPKYPGVDQHGRPFDFCRQGCTGY